ncbi:MAG: hypothetical protein M1830_000361 [Pleopsidium flavum]|nr:MAG: hypothetical protein M1830_000361 [Pleopsidium flavum]
MAIGMRQVSGGEWSSILEYMRTDGETFIDHAETDLENKKKDFNGSNTPTNIVVHGLKRRKRMAEMIWPDTIKLGHMVKICSETTGRIIALIRDQIKESWEANGNRLAFRVEPIGRRVRRIGIPIQCTLKRNSAKEQSIPFEQMSPD